ncbi:MAG: ABC transporter substrate-binding protein [Dehalococcoidia bacterium]|nr:ABC transporter substrate-binding protein [Dehalococcoidia bacterium]
MRKYMRWATLLALAAVLAVASMSCSGEAKETYKIGAVLSLTGAASHLGKPEENTIKMMVKEINDAGGINGHQLEVIIYNDETNAERCATLTNRLIETDKVMAIIGPSTTGNSMALIDIVTTAKIPLVSLAAGINIVTPIEERYWVFKTPQADLQVVNELYSYFEREGLSRIALLTDVSGFGAGGRGFLLSEAGKFGITIVEDQTFASEDTNMQAQLTRIKGTNAEAVVCWATDKESAIVAQDMQTLKMTIPLFASHGIANKDFITAAGSAANGVIFPAGKLLVVDIVPDGDPQKSVLTKYKSDYEAQYGVGSVNTFGGHAYDALSMVVMALEELPEGLSLTEARAAIRNYVESIEGFAGTGGVFSMTPTDHLGMAPGSIVMIKIIDGEWTWID